ncbi:MAG TPA: baseplate J/gp47 family protein [Candidatus Limnocylindria bacterium]|nr:baseplate J/gp47 family protein [Candidatus Limnocylindria bacterium]
MASEPQIVYLEPDDEITSVVRRLRETDASRVVLVAPGRTKATSSVVALRLLAEVAREEGREVALVADPLARTLAAEAGISAFATVPEATSGAAPAAEGAPARRAAIHVVRPESPASPPRSGASDETRAVPVVGPAGPRQAGAPPREPRPAPRPRPAPVRRPVAKRRSVVPVVGVAVIIVALLAAVGVAAAVLPAATIHITPVARAVGPLRYVVTPPNQDHVSGELERTLSAEATGDHVERTTARGAVLFQSGNPGRCRVPQGTRVAAGKIEFQTVETVTVPEGKFTGHGIDPGQASVGIVALAPGTAGNVAAGAIDTIEDDRITFCLRGFPNTTHRLVSNPKATAGGDETHTPEVTQEDVDGLKTQVEAALGRDLTQALAAKPDAIVIVPAEPEQPRVDIPKDLVGSRGQETFELTGTLAYDRPSVARADVEEAARQQLLDDATAIPAGTTLDPESIDVAIGDPTLDGDVVKVAVQVSAAAIPELDVARLRKQVAGKTPGEAQALLGGIGVAKIDLWPGWVSRIPTMDWRVSIDVASTDGVSSQAPGAP